ncbi:MAG: SDR family oxidoreductase [Candidatus Woesearchaeota archaeon]|nr:SDR family oxidoreductase [Candidatus Woesearchaeota archaeon]
MSISSKTMKKYKLFITGGSGMLGSALCFELGKSYEITASYNSFPVSFANAEFVKIELSDYQESERIISGAKPDFLIHAAAITNVDLCEENPILAEKINAEATENIAKICREHRIKMVYISTDYIFDGKRGNYSEKDIPSPINVYAKTKYEGELNVSKTLDDFLIIRTSLFGWNIESKKSFVE